MLNGTLVLRLPQAQVGHLLEYCTAYRSYLWQATLPTPERNQLIRQVQSVQARLERARAGGQQESEVWMSEQEKQAGGQHPEQSGGVVPSAGTLRRGRAVVAASAGDC